MVLNKRLTSKMNGEFVIFLIGMRINNPFLVHKWIPVALSMPRMLREIYSKNLGLLSHEMWISRTIIVLQYWRSLDELLYYATAKESEHLPAWQKFNKAIGANGAVGIWHETYVIKSGCYENVYVNMPKFGLGKAGELVEAKAGLQSAHGRLAKL